MQAMEFCFVMMQQREKIEFGVRETRKAVNESIRST